MAWQYKTTNFSHSDIRHECLFFRRSGRWKVYCKSSTRCWVFARRPSAHSSDMAEKSGGENDPNSGRGHPNSDMGKHGDQPKDAGKETKGVETGGDGSANAGQNSANAASSSASASASASSQHKTEIEETQIQNDGKGPSPERGTANENTDKNVDTSRQVQSEKTAGVPKDKKRSDKAGEHDRSESGAGNDSPVDLGQRDKEEVGSGRIKTDDEDKDTNTKSGGSHIEGDDVVKGKGKVTDTDSGKKQSYDKTTASNTHSKKNGASVKSNDKSDNPKAPPGSGASGKNNDKSKAPPGSGQGKQGDASKKVRVCKTLLVRERSTGTALAST